MEVKVSISRKTLTRHRPAYAAWARGSSRGQDFAAFSRVFHTSASLARARGGDPLASSEIRAKSPGRTRFIGVWSGSEAGMLRTLRFDSGLRPETASHDFVEPDADWQPGGQCDDRWRPPEARRYRRQNGSSWTDPISQRAPVRVQYLRVP